MSPSQPIWEGIYSSFREVPAEGPGFDGEAWITNSLKKMEEMRKHAQNGAALPPPSNYREGLLPLLAALTCRENKRLRILDFGGGIGFTYYQTVFALPQTASLEYYIVERENVCKAGKEFFGETDGKLVFSSTLPEKDRDFDIVYTGSVLHYIDDWKHLLSQLCNYSPKYLLIADVLAGNISTFATAQHYYNSRIPVWFFSVDEVIQSVHSLGYELMFKSAYRPTVMGVEQDLPTQNLGEGHCLKNTCNLLFAKAAMP